MKTPFALVIAAAGAIFRLTLGIRTAQSLFISAINSQSRLGLVAISLAFAVSQLLWGASQPFAGALADRYGAGRVLAGAGCSWSPSAPRSSRPPIPPRC